MKMHRLTTGILMLLFCMATFAQAESKQELFKFSHKFHLEMEFECTMCHVTAEESTEAGEYKVPGHDECGACHDIFETEDACKKCHVDPEMPMPFERVERTLIVSHENHLSNEELEMACQTCHEGLREVEFAGPEQIPAMATCMTCHDDALAPSACSVCHTEPESALRPESHTFDFSLSHKSFARADEEECLTCHVEEFCSDCHDGALGMNSRALGTDQYTPFQPEASHTSKGQILKRVHDLNYRYIHGVDAKSKLSTCSTCHDTGEFCSECHSDDDNLDRIKPVWHGGSNWGAIAGGIGTGGGLHGEMARRDMELCIACHDDVTADPVCMVCHNDRRPGIGNDPKTHAARFMHDENGEWHDDDMSICYDCHQNTRMAGVGFCGYCHGAEHE